MNFNPGTPVNVISGDHVGEIGKVVIAPNHDGMCGVMIGGRGFMIHVDHLSIAEQTWE